MAAEELGRVSVVSDLSKQALHEYEDLQRRSEAAAMQCQRLEEERDAAVKKLSEIQQVSQMVIQEVSVIQEDLEIERMCRESAEALASKVVIESGGAWHTVISQPTAAEIITVIMAHSASVQKPSLSTELQQNRPVGD